MNFKNRFLPLFFIAVISSLVLMSCGKKEETAEVKEFKDNDTVGVKVFTVVSGNFNITKTFSGSVEGFEQANVTAKVPERIIELKVKVGSVVSKGQLLAVLDKSGASSQFYQAKASLENAEKDLERMKKLYEQGAISLQMLEGVQLRYDVAKANFDGAKDAVEIHAPISGTVTVLNVALGDNANPAMPMMVIANISRLKAIFNVGETDIPYFKNGQRVQVFSDNKPEMKINGVVSEITKSADVQSRTFQIKADFNNTADRFFNPGMFSKTEVNLMKLQGLSVPFEAVINENGVTYVYVIKDNKSYRQNIVQGITDGKTVEVKEGLNAGDVVVTVGMNNLKEGKRVFIAKD